MTMHDEDNIAFIADELAISIGAVSRYWLTLRIGVARKLSVVFSAACTGSHDEP